MALAALALLVLLLHCVLGLAVQRLHDSWLLPEAMPPRLAVSYVRELQVSPPALPAAGVRNMAKAPARAWQIPPLKATEMAKATLPEPVPESPQLPELADLLPRVAATPDPPPGEPGPEWPPSTRMSYVLTGNYRGAVHGNAQVEWLREGSHYQVHLDVAVGPSFAPLMSRRMSSDGFLDARGISPKRYDEDTRILFSERRRATVIFRQGEVQLADGRSEASQPDSQDAASQFVQLTWLFLTGRQVLRPGLVVELPLALPRRQYRWRYEVLGEKELQTPMGPLATWHLRPSSVASGGDLTAEVWLAPTLQYLPVRIRIRQDDSTFVDLMLKAPAVQAASTDP